MITRILSAYPSHSGLFTNKRSKSTVICTVLKQSTLMLWNKSVFCLQCVWTSLKLLWTATSEPITAIFPPSLHLHVQMLLVGRVSQKKDICGKDTIWHECASGLLPTLQDVNLYATHVYNLSIYRLAVCPWFPAQEYLHVKLLCKLWTEISLK